MLSSKIYNKYLENKCVEVWKEISFLDYSLLQKTERETINNIIKETLVRIDCNVRLVYSILQKFGFQYHNFGSLNTSNKEYLLRDTDSYNENINNFYLNKNDECVLPLFFASFCSFFKVIDFRGNFSTFNVSILLDSLFIESFNNQQEVEDLLFKREYKDKIVNCCMFSPDQYIKEDSSGDLGSCILLDRNLFIDNYVVNFCDDFEFTFVEYLRFCFEWSCFPNLFWSSDDEKQPFLPILDKVRRNLRPF